MHSSSTAAPGPATPWGSNDIRFATGAVPQPAALLLLALGLTLGILRRTTH